MEKRILLIEEVCGFRSNLAAGAYDRDVGTLLMWNFKRSRALKVGGKEEDAVDFYTQFGRQLQKSGD